METLPEEFKTPEAARTIANYLRSNMKSRSGVEHERRVDFFKGNVYLCIYTFLYTHVCIKLCVTH